MLEGFVSFNSPFPQHFSYHPILGSFSFKLLDLGGGGVLFIPCCGFFGPEIMQDSENPVLRLSGKATVYIYDKNITNEIHKQCHRCHIWDSGGCLLWMPTWKWNEQPKELKSQGYFLKDAICFPKAKEQQIKFSPSLVSATQNIRSQGI